MSTFFNYCVSLDVHNNYYAPKEIYDKIPIPVHNSVKRTDSLCLLKCETKSYKYLQSMNRALREEAYEVAHKLRYYLSWIATNRPEESHKEHLRSSALQITCTHFDWLSQKYTRAYNSYNNIYMNLGKVTSGLEVFFSNSRKVYKASALKVWKVLKNYLILWNEHCRTKRDMEGRMFKTERLNLIFSWHITENRRNAHWMNKRQREDPHLLPERNPHRQRIIKNVDEFMGRK